MILKLLGLLPLASAFCTQKYAGIHPNCENISCFGVSELKNVVDQCSINPICDGFSFPPRKCPAWLGKCTQGNGAAPTGAQKVTNSNDWTWNQCLEHCKASMRKSKVLGCEFTSGVGCTFHYHSIGAADRSTGSYCWLMNSCSQTGIGCWKKNCSPVQEPQNGYSKTGYDYYECGQQKQGGGCQIDKTFCWSTITKSDVCTKWGCCKRDGSDAWCQDRSAAWCNDECEWHVCQPSCPNGWLCAADGACYDTKNNVCWDNKCVHKFLATPNPINRNAIQVSQPSQQWELPKMWDNIVNNDCYMFTFDAIPGWIASIVDPSINGYICENQYGKMDLGTMTFANRMLEAVTLPLCMAGSPMEAEFNNGIATVTMLDIKIDLCYILQKLAGRVVSTKLKGFIEGQVKNLGQKMQKGGYVKQGAQVQKYTEMWYGKDGQPGIFGKGKVASFIRGKIEQRLLYNRIGVRKNMFAPTNCAMMKESMIAFITTIQCSVNKFAGMDGLEWFQAVAQGINWFLGIVKEATQYLPIEDLFPKSMVGLKFLSSVYTNKNWLMQPGITFYAQYKWWSLTQVASIVLQKMGRNCRNVKTKKVVNVCSRVCEKATCILTLGFFCDGENSFCKPVCKGVVEWVNEVVCTAIEITAQVLSQIPNIKGLIPDKKWSWTGSMGGKSIAPLLNSFPLPNVKKVVEANIRLDGRRRMEGYDEVEEEWTNFDKTKKEEIADEDLYEKPDLSDWDPTSTAERMNREDFEKMFNVHPEGPEDIADHEDGFDEEFGFMSVDEAIHRRRLMEEHDHDEHFHNKTIEYLMHKGGDSDEDVEHFTNLACAQSKDCDDDLCTFDEETKKCQLKEKLAKRWESRHNDLDKDDDENVDELLTKVRNDTEHYDVGVQNTHEWLEKVHQIKDQIMKELGVAMKAANCEVQIQVKDFDETTEEEKRMRRQKQYYLRHLIAFSKKLTGHLNQAKSGHAKCRWLRKLSAKLTDKDMFKVMVHATGAVKDLGKAKNTNTTVFSDDHKDFSKSVMVDEEIFNCLKQKTITKECEAKIHNHMVKTGQVGKAMAKKKMEPKDECEDTEFSFCLDNKLVDDANNCLAEDNFDKAIEKCRKTCKFCKKQPPSPMPTPPPTPPCVDEWEICNKATEASCKKEKFAFKCRKSCKVCEVQSSEAYEKYKAGCLKLKDSRKSKTCKRKYCKENCDPISQDEMKCELFNNKHCANFKGCNVIKGRCEGKIEW